KVPGKVWKLTYGTKTINVAPGKMNPTKLANLKKQGWKVTQQGKMPVAAKAAVPGYLQSKLMKPIEMDQETLEKTPGYQWALGQGLKSTGFAMTPKGLVGSGAAIKGAMEYGQGLASQTYQQQFQNELANQQKAWEALYGTAALGESAATGVSAAALKAGELVGANLQNIGGAKGGADLATGAAISKLAENA